MSTSEYNPVLTRANRFELFTPAECEQILTAVLSDQNQKGILKQHKIVPVIEAVGFLGEYYNLILDYQLEDESAQRQTRLFVKSMVYENATREFYEEKARILKKEANSYDMLINDMKKFSKHVWCAKCYFTRDDLIVMENVEDLGYASLTTDFLQENQLMCLLRALATVHASSVAYERQRCVTIGVKFMELLKEVSIQPNIDWWTTGVRAALAITATHPKVRDDPLAQEYIANELPMCLDRIYFMLNPSPVHRNVFQHRDPWGGNALYHKERPLETNCILVDFQLCRYGPPALDFLMASYLNVEPAQRRLMMEHVSSGYHEHLVAELESMGIDAQKEQLSRADFEQSLKDYTLFAVILNCVLATVLRVPDNYLKKLKDEQPEEFHRYCNVNRTESVLKLMNEYVDYERYVYECVWDLLEQTYYK